MKKVPGSKKERPKSMFVVRDNPPPQERRGSLNRYSFIDQESGADPFKCLKELPRTPTEKMSRSQSTQDVTQSDQLLASPEALKEEAPILNGFLPEELVQRIITTSERRPSRTSFLDVKAEKPQEKETPHLHGTKEENRPIFSMGVTSPSKKTDARKPNKDDATISKETPFQVTSQEPFHKDATPSHPPAEPIEPSKASPLDDQTRSSATLQKDPSQPVIMQLDVKEERVIDIPSTSTIAVPSNGKMAIEEVEMLKYGRWGKPHKRIVWISTDQHSICWKESGKEKFDSISLKEMSDVVDGCQTKVFKRFKNICREKSGVCLSIVTPKRTLDLELNSPEQKEDWIRKIKAAAAM
eukprot:TRINITY_DN2501_c0_g1_i4.p1 TRINITY_DN2501_c0_g1~~TRINITY_DN2501_c0_g1_i4.p1  ORF type:complete len:354 (-),score=107.89 TRINITY_DN2501_c0_g1_i4:29-1090(-)